MRLVLNLIAGLLLCSSHGASFRDADPVGTWEGESKCTVPGSPCHDEHALYRFSPDKNDAKKLSLDAYKIVGGKPEFMGTIECEFHAPLSALSCTGHTPKQDDWEFQISGDAMTGTLTIGAEKTLYRRIALHKRKDK